MDLNAKITIASALTCLGGCKSWPKITMTYITIGRALMEEQIDWAKGLVGSGTRRCRAPTPYEACGIP